ncbi:hypothetical protein [Daejeonella oryzae]|uniref:hypothetical protein n=1 Tax=Daejeonella oryzae TaxID=1122943 RepID=UPI00047A104F|nr:hypothetical protein [Daejeonella oryzae]
MKNSLIILVLLAAFSSCQSDRKENSKTADTTSLNSNIPKNEVKQLDLPWVAVLNDSTQLMEIKKNPLAISTNLTATDLIDALNLKYPLIKLELVEIAANKAIVKIDDAAYLTQQIGSEGARIYLAEATFALTELPDIAAVDFRFKEGDHASPQILNRNSFKDFN